MRQLGINNYFIGWTQTFLINKTVEIVIDRHKNLEKEIKIRIPYGFQVLPILFLLYINKIIDAVIAIWQEISSVFFTNDIRIFANNNFIKKIAIYRKITRKTVFK